VCWATQKIPIAMGVWQGVAMDSGYTAPSRSGNNCRKIAVNSVSVANVAALLGALECEFVLIFYHVIPSPPNRTICESAENMCIIFSCCSVMGIMEQHEEMNLISNKINSSYCSITPSWNNNKN
jgi:hypothetical protein